MSIHSVIDLLVGIHEHKSTRDVVSRLESILAEYKFEYYGIVRQPRPSENTMGTVLAGRWPAGWPESYLSKKYVLIDPTIRMLATAQRPFRWRDTVQAYRADPHRKRMDRMMADAARHGLKDGYIFPVHGRNGLIGNMTVGGRPVDLAAADLATFDALARALFWRMLELSDQAANYQTMPTVNTQMTRREMEVLNLLAEGMTSHEIARQLTLSNHTVDWYMNGIQDKLEAKNRQHAVASAFRYGLIS